MAQIVVDVPDYEAGDRGLRISVDGAAEIKSVMDLREVDDEAEGTVLGRDLYMLLACDPRLGLGGRIPSCSRLVEPELRDGVCAWWFAFPDYEVRGGELYPNRNTREEWQ